jgi:hypothetical protein
MSNNARTPPGRLSDDSSATFLIRWRGRQEGPYTAAAIEAKLGANQIGLLHEIFHNGQWVTLRACLGERDALWRAQQETVAEEEKRARAQSDQGAKEREELRQAEIAEASRSTQLTQANQTLATSQPAKYLAKIYSILLETVCLVSLLAFFLPNITISIPILGNTDVSMFDFLTSKANSSKAPAEKPKRPSVENVGDLKLSKLTLGPVICLISLLVLVFHYLTTMTWGILTFGFRKTLSSFNTVWLCLGLQFPILFSIGVHMTLASVKNDVPQQSGQLDPGAIGTLLGLALVNNISIGPGVIMWILMALALLAVGTNAIQHPSRT